MSGAVYTITARASKAIENRVLIAEMKSLADQLHVDSSNQLYGVASHERIHQIDGLDRYLARLDAIIAEEVK